MDLYSVAAGLTATSRMRAPVVTLPGCGAAPSARLRASLTRSSRLAALQSGVQLA
jgi:hypothetical protein